jgi:dihydrofolate reductase
VSTARTRIEREFDPDAVRRLKATADSDLTVGGADLAAQAIEAGLVDEYQLFLVPVVVGAGKRAFPISNVRVKSRVAGRTPFRQRDDFRPVPRSGVTVATRTFAVREEAIPDRGDRNRV